MAEDKWDRDWRQKDPSQEKRGIVSSRVFKTSITPHPHPSPQELSKDGEGPC